MFCCILSQPQPGLVREQKSEKLMRENEKVYFQNLIWFRARPDLKNPENSSFILYLFLHLPEQSQVYVAVLR